MIQDVVQKIIVVMVISSISVVSIRKMHSDRQFCATSTSTSLESETLFNTNSTMRQLVTRMDEKIYYSAGNTLFLSYSRISLPRGRVCMLAISSNASFLLLVNMYFSPRSSTFALLNVIASARIISDSRVSFPLIYIPNVISRVSNRTRRRGNAAELIPSDCGD
jgi:hypothetical protein